MKHGTGTDDHRSQLEAFARAMVEELRSEGDERLSDIAIEHGIVEHLKGVPYGYRLAEWLREDPTDSR